MTSNTERKLLQELEENKQKLFKLVEKLEGTAESVDKILPQKYDFKNRYILIDRVQTLTQLYDTILRYRSEIAKQIKEQINITQNLSEDPSEIRDSIVRMSVDQLKELIKD